MHRFFQSVCAPQAVRSSRVKGFICLLFVQLLHWYYTAWRRRSSESINLPHVMLKSCTTSWNLMQDCTALLSQLRMVFTKNNKISTYMCVLFTRRINAHWNICKNTTKTNAFWCLWAHKRMPYLQKHTKPLGAFEALILRPSVSTFTSLWHFFSLRTTSVKKKAKSELWDRGDVRINHYHTLSQSPRHLILFFYSR